MLVPTLLACSSQASLTLAKTAPSVATHPPAAPDTECLYPAPYIVFFDMDRDAISRFTRRILNNLVDVYALCGNGVALIVDGHTDRSGEAAHNLALSRRRATAVLLYLERLGIPAGVVTTQAFGESRPLIETLDGVPEPQNRRVEISFGPPAG
jgi:OOP family OmpA-OmpF porin